MKTLTTQFENITKLKMFEIEVLRKDNNKLEYIGFNLSIENNCLIATHNALTIKESKSDKIPTKSIELDNIFSLDENLQVLYEICVDAICVSDFYELV